MFKDSHKTIGVTTVAFSGNEYLVNLLKDRTGLNVKINSKGLRFQQDELIDFLLDCDYAIVGLDVINADVLQSLPKLKAISKYGVGLDNISLSDCDRYNVKLLYTNGVNKRSVAELTLSLILSLLRNVYFTSNKMKLGEWIKNGGMQLTGKTVGIIGLGNIGRDVMNLLKPFGCNILVNDLINLEEFCQENGCIFVSKEEIFQKSDVITIHTPLTDDTWYLINSLSIDLMKKSSIIINTSRGGIVNQADLKKALIEGRIAGAGLDVFEVEPPQDLEFIKIPNLITTPHIGGNSKEAVIAMGEASINNLLTHIN